VVVICLELSLERQSIRANWLADGPRQLVNVDVPPGDAAQERIHRGLYVAARERLLGGFDGVDPELHERGRLVIAACPRLPERELEDLDIPRFLFLNKIDKADANPDHVKGQLAEHGVTIEEYGGDTPLVPVSAKTKVGIDDLVETVLLVADIWDTSQLRHLRHHHAAAAAAYVAVPPMRHSGSPSNSSRAV